MSDVGREVLVLITGSDNPRYSSSPGRNQAVFVLSHGIRRSRVIAEFLLRPLSNLDDIAKGSCPGRNGFTLMEKRKIKQVNRDQSLILPLMAIEEVWRALTDRQGY